MKKLMSLVDDIYHVVSTKEIPEGVDAEAVIEEFGESVKAMMRTQFSEYKRDPRNLRLSAVGHPDRKLWHKYNGTPQEKIQPHTYVKFLYGHLIEEMLLALVKLSGHEVTNTQDQCDVGGVKGHMDCSIDGVVTDVKSASVFGFKKFKDATLAYDDPFGYVAQIKAYAKSKGEDKYGWLAMDKQNGHLTYLLYDEKDILAPVHGIISYDIEERVEHVKEMVKGPMPEPCAVPVPDGKSGNMKLPMMCSYCDFKRACYPNLRAFAYSNGPRFLTEVAKVPNVQEIPLVEVVDATENN